MCGRLTPLSSMEERYPEDHDAPEQPRDHRARSSTQPRNLPSGIIYEDRPAVIIGTGPGAAHDARSGYFNTAPDNDSVSPSEAHGSYGDYSREPDHNYLPRFGGPSNAPMMLNPKRAYRQRRKDPSCDACRERKVKVRRPSQIVDRANHKRQCDATDTSSCTECSSRNVRCQFTKDTNRRMSSIK